MSLRLLVFFLLEIAIAATANAQEKVSFPGRDGVALSATLYRPVGTGPFAAIVAMHGCGGPWKARDDDWSERLQAAGYLVLFPDSFGSRGMGPQCNVRERVMTSKDRAEDAFSSAEWLASRPDVVMRISAMAATDFNLIADSVSLRRRTAFHRDRGHRRGRPSDRADGSAGGYRGG